MPNKLTTKSKATTTKPAFKSAAEEADWYYSPEGREHAKRKLRKAIRKGTITLTDKVSVHEASQLATETGKVVVARKGVTTKQAAALKTLLDEARAGVLMSVSLRISPADIAAARKLAAKRGIGYQTLLKELISEGLHKASEAARATGISGKSIATMPSPR